MNDADAAVAEAIAALRERREAEVLAAVTAAAERHPGHTRLQQALGMLHRALGDLAPAIAALDRAAALAPDNASIAHVRARAHLEAGLPALAQFEAAEALAPTDAAVRLGKVSAMFAEQGNAAAIAALEAMLAEDPGWVAGQAQLAKLRWAAGDRAHFADTLAAALARAPTDLALWGAYLSALTQAGRHEAVLEGLARGRAATGGDALFDVCEATAHDDLGDRAAATAAFAALGEPAQPDVALHKVRHLLRAGQYAAAGLLAERWAETPARTYFWPYLSIAWRLTGDKRWAWLEGGEALAGIYDLGDAVGPLEALAGRLRALHLARDQPLDQSVRGGTQTDGALFNRIDPEIGRLKAAVTEAVARYVAQLPPRDPKHETLAPRRDAPVRFAGSWSVRLAGAGCHASHIHPGGWLSSAFYVALPDESEAGPPPAGWLTLGVPPPELGLDLPPLRRIEPRPGRLVLFPSTLWHGTEPFAAGERLTAAFDVLKPG
jgi:tetratricopeptide (TPR) repeat protein